MPFFRASLIAALSLAGTASMTSAAEAYQPYWKSLKADNGAEFMADLNSIQRYNTGAAEIVIYAVEGKGFNPANMTRLLFDCQGHYQDEANLGVTLYAPPNSVLGQIQTIACSREGK